MLSFRQLLQQFLISSEQPKPELSGEIGTETRMNILLHAVHHRYSRPEDLRYSENLFFNIELGLHNTKKYDKKV